MRSGEEQARLGVADRTNGWWISEVLAAFGYLEREFHYRVAEVALHFRGSSVRYAGGVFDLAVSHDPEDTGRLSAELWVRDDLERDAAHPRAFAVNDVLRARDPSVILPDPTRPNLTRSEVRSAIAIWSALLKELAPDVLKGDWPAGVQPTHLW
jgi:hypothetical protein